MHVPHERLDRVLRRWGPSANPALSGQPPRRGDRALGCRSSASWFIRVSLGRVAATCPFRAGCDDAMRQRGVTATPAYARRGGSARR